MKKTIKTLYMSGLIAVQYFLATLCFAQTGQQPEKAADINQHRCQCIIQQGKQIQTHHVGDHYRKEWATP